MTDRELNQTKFTVKERRKAFDEMFRLQIVPFFEKQGFDRHTKTSKRLIKKLSDELIAIISLEHRNYGRGAYYTMVEFLDADFTDYLNSEYFAWLDRGVPKIRSDTPANLDIALSNWLKEMEEWVIPFVNEHATYSSILDDAEHFSIPLGRIEKFEERIRLRAIGQENA